MKLHFDPNQPFQHDASNSIVGIFEGQPFLKSGGTLTAKIEQKDLSAYGDARAGGFYLVNDTEIALILEKVDKEIIKTVIEAKPQKVITIDRLFNNNDPLKTNTALQMKDVEIEFKVV